MDKKLVAILYHVYDEETRQYVGASYPEVLWDNRSRTLKEVQVMLNKEACEDVAEKENHIADTLYAVPIQVNFFDWQR